MIKALFFDIDGTLVSFKTHQIPASTVSAIEAAHKKGIYTFISTGRPKAIINNMGELDALNLIDGYVSMNGAYCFVGEKVVYSKNIPNESVLSIARYVEHNNICSIFVHANSICVYKPNKMVEDIFYNYLHVDKIPETSIEEALKENIYQITPFLSIEQGTEMLKNVQGCIGNRWHPAFTDITATGCEKSHGVEMIAEYFGFTKDNVMCFGDGGNDISMLKYASIGVAMGNAAEKVKAAANYVTTSIDDNGISNALKHFNII